MRLLSLIVNHARALFVSPRRRIFLECEKGIGQVIILEAKAFTAFDAMKAINARGIQAHFVCWQGAGWHGVIRVCA